MMFAPVLVFGVVTSAGCGGAGGEIHASEAHAGSIVGQPVPDLKLAGLGGSAALHLRDLRGKVLLVDVWASWCAPCKEELPMLDEMSDRLAAKGIQIVAVSIDESRDDAEAFLKSRPKWSIFLASDPEGKTLGILQPPQMPSSFIVDRDGTIREVNAGFSRSDAAKIEARLVELADASSAKTSSDSTSSPHGNTSLQSSSGETLDHSFAPKVARLTARKNGRVVLNLSRLADCASSGPPNAGDPQMTLMVPWREGYKADLAALQRLAMFNRVTESDKSGVSKAFKPTGTIRIVSAPTTKNAVGKISLNLTSDDYNVAGDLDVLVCVSPK
jgi:thiol-disulfide isomerase/thioredoxin